jgi:outer membrane protein TolC
MKRRRRFEKRASITAFVWLVGVGAPSVQAQESREGEALTLAEAVALAHETHPSVGVARAVEDAAAAGVGMAKSEWWPKLGTGAALTSYSEPMLVAPLHGFGPEDVAQIEFERTLIQGNVSFAWTLYDGGARGARINGARAASAGATAGRSATEQMLTARVTVAYLRVLTARGVLDAKDRRINSMLAERRRVEQFLAEGQAAQVELLRVDAALAEAEAERVATVTQLDLAERDLARLVDVRVDDARVDRLVPVRLDEEMDVDERGHLVESAFTNNPQLERMRQDVTAAEAAHRLTKADWIPHLDVTGAGQVFSSDAGNTSSLWSVGVGLTYPIFTGGARSNNVSQAGAHVRRAAEDLRLAELQAEEAVDRALNVALETRALVAALANVVQHQTEVARIERLSLEAGAGTQTDYLRAEADLSRARSLLVEAQHAEIAARVELARVIGELTPEWLAGNLEIAR